MKENKNRFREVYEILSNLNKLQDAGFENRSDYNGIQLPAESKYRGEVQESYYGSADRYDFLFNKENNYRRLYHFLQTSRRFRDFQTREIKLHMGLFAYVDYEASARMGLRYLYGPMDLPVDSNKPKPNFFLKSYYENDGKFLEEGPDHFSSSMEGFYYSRQDTPRADLDFSRILQDEENFKFKRTEFEKDNEMIYAPSGEMDGCILMWILLILEDGYKTELLHRLKNIDLGSVNKQFLNDECLVQLDLRFLKPGNILRQDYKIPYENREYNFFDWMRLIGLVNYQKGKNWDLTERGNRFLRWLVVYVESILKPSAANYNNYYGILEKIDEDQKRIDPAVIYNYWLQDIGNEHLIAFTKLARGARRKKWNKQSRQALFFEAIRIMLNWKEPATASKLESIDSFQKRCRFNLYSHFILRSGERGDINENSSRGWIVFPILSEKNASKQMGDKLQFHHVGFFLGTFNDSVKQGNRTLGYFENLSQLKPIVQETIFKLKTIIGKLGEVENREIFYAGIFEDRVAKDLFHRLYHSQYTFLEVLRILSTQLPSALSKTFEMAYDSLGKYLDIAKYLPNKLDEYLKGYQMKNELMKDIINEAKLMTAVIFQEKSIAQQIFKISRDSIDLFINRSSSDSLINIENKAKGQMIRADKGLSIIIFKELLVNALRNTPRYDPSVSIRVELEANDLCVTIQNTYSKGGPVAKAMTSTFGLKIIEELIKGLDWKKEVEEVENIYSYKVLIPLTQNPPK